MTIRSMNSLRFLWLTLFALSGLPAAWANNNAVDHVRFGETARTFAAGAIQQTIPQDGIVNLITGDNQTVGNRMRLGQNDVFYLKLNKPGDAKLGDFYTIFKRSRKVFHPATGEYMGYLVNRLAVVQIVQVDDVLTAARAVRTYSPVSPGDPVVKFSLPPQPDLTSTSTSGDITGMVVELQSDVALTLVAQRNIVYLDKGSEDGLQPGDYMNLVRYGGGLPSRNVGEVKVLSTQGRTATALVTKSTSRILKGDRFQVKTRTAAMLPPGDPQLDKLSSDTPESTTEVQKTAGDARYSLNDFMKQLRFESGEATISTEGYQALDRLIEQLKSGSPEQLIRVEGHADNMEIGPSLKSTYPTNWDLSKARASGVLHYIVEKGGIDTARISSVGYGDTKPVASNATEAGRQQNRRVDIVLYSQDSAAAHSETVPPSEESMDRAQPAPDPAAEQAAAAVSMDDNVVPSGSVNTESSAPAAAKPISEPIPTGTDQAMGKPMEQSAAAPHQQ
ncbi:OmpA family protein [Petrachloros mirabilis]